MGLRLIALICLVGAAFAGPFQRESESRCATKCTQPSQPKFNYEPGKKYVYEYRGENVITVAGRQKQKARIEGIAEIHLVTKCEGILKLKNVRIEQKLSTEEIEELRLKLEIPIHFAWVDGKVEHVCPSPEDSKLSLNIKKGVISTMINTMSKLDKPEEVKEYDSLGFCKTKYTVSYAHGLVVQKEKYLKSCTNRHASITSLISNPYESPESKIHTLPIFPQEKLVCKQHIEDQIIKSVQCIEFAKIKPLKERDSVIEFEGKIELKLLSKDPAEMLRLHEPKSQESLLYNLEEEQDSSEKEREAEEILREMCSKTSGVVDVAVSREFIKLVSVVRSLSHHSLERMHTSLKDGRICNKNKVRDIFVDTLPMAGSDAAVKLMVQLLERKEITGLKAKLWPATLALISNPTKHTVAAVVPLLKMKQSASAILGVSAMVHRFCSKENCDSVSAVQQIVSILNNQLGHDCSSDNEEQIFSALKAFGNMGYLGDAEKDILACARNSNKPTRLRLAAIDAFRRSFQKRPQALLELYSNTEEDIEVRIAALSSTMKRADEEQLRQIKHVAENEQNEQMSGYASTLIKNMKKTSSQLKKGVRKLLQEIEVNTPKVNYWENSKNIEVSTFSEALNLGVSVEGDLVHSSESKIPRSMYTRLDADIFDHNINFFEVGVRAEGLEALIKRLIGIKDKIPKLPSWKNLISTKNLIGETYADVSLFIRTMNTEIFDVAASDLTAVGEMIEIAEIMRKLAQGKQSDFSHSFLFLNSKLVVPSVTGRSYSIDLTGSATVGLTASTKLNVLSFPRHADVNLHLQPSVNVEISTTVGIQSNKHRPDVKLVSRMHLQSDMAAKLQIKDGHAALASLSLPSENVVLAKMSTDVIEIDSNHRERRVYEKMQKKIDYCFDKLSKPLGISVCGLLEVPKPFVTRSFPFINAVGNLEFSIKKSDISFKSYEIELEIPKHLGATIMKYKASMDTPGSRISRRFASELEIKQHGQGHREFTLELTSPFKSAGGSGSYTLRHDLLQGSVELHSSSSRLLAANVSTEVSATRYRTTYKPSLFVSYQNREPLRVGGSISVIKGRKQQISIDITSNKPSSKPLSLKGTIMKEGSFEVSRSAEWKLSSDISMQTPLVDAQLRSAVEKKSKHSHTYSSSLSLDYQRRGMRKHSVKFTAATQKSSGKASHNAHFESSEFPAASWILNWDVQGESRHSLKNDLILKYGRNPETQHINIKHRSRMPEHGRGECKVSIKAPQLNVDSELTVAHESEYGEAPKIYLEADLALTKDKHYRTLFRMDYESKLPLKAQSRAEFEYPGGKIAYWDEIDEPKRNHFEGKSSFQWREDKQVELKYKYRQLNDEYKLHHELETSLKVPSSHIPIKGKTSLRVSESSVSIDGRLNMERNDEYSIQAHLTQEGVNHISLKAPQVEGNLKISNEESKKALDLDLKLKKYGSKHITASAVAEFGDKKKFHAELLLDADRHPDQKILLTTSVETTSGQTYSGSSKLQVLDLVSITLRESGDLSLSGSNEASLEASLKNYDPIKIEYSQELSRDQAKSQLKFSKNHVEKVQIEMEGSLSNHKYGREIAARASVQSLDNSFESMEASMSHKHSLSGRSTTMKSHLTFHRGSSKVYKAEWVSDLQENGLEMKAELNTPHENFENQALDVVYKKSSQGIETSFSLQTSDKKIISLTSELKKKSNGISTTLSLKSPFRAAREVKASLSFENQRSKKSLQSYIDVNSVRITEVQVSMVVSSNELETQGRVKISPIPNVQLQGLSFSYHRSSSSMTAALKAELKNEKEISISSEIKEERDTISCTVSLNSPYKSLKDAKAHLSIENQQPKRSLLFYIDANAERKGDVEVSVSSSSRGVEIQGRLKTIHTPEVSGHFKVERREESVSVSAKVLRGTSPLFSTTLNREIQQDSQVYSIKTQNLEKTLIDLQLSREVSGDSLTKVSLKVSGQFSPLSLSVSSSRNEDSSLNMDISACRGSGKQSCYYLKSNHQSLRNSKGYRHYKSITFNLERSNGQSAAQSLAKVELFYSKNEHDYRSKVIVEYQGEKLGYVMSVHRKEDEHDHCSFDAHIFMPDTTSRFRGSVALNSERVLLELEAVPNAAVPSRSYSFEYKEESHSSGNQLSAFLKMSTPKMIKPLLLTARFDMEDRQPIRGKLELLYSQSDKSLTLEVETQSNEQHRSIEYKLYREDKSLEASLKLMRRDSRKESMYGYEWSFKSSKSAHKKGGLSLKFSHKKVHISYFSPQHEVQFQADAAEAPSDVSVSLSSKGRKIKEITIRTSHSCVNLEIMHSGPLFKSSVCLNKHDGTAVKLVSFVAHYNHYKCWDFHVSLDPESPSYVDVILRWKKEYIIKALSELSGMNALLKNRSLKEIQQEIEEHLKQYKRDVIMPKWKQAMRHLQELKEEYMRKMKHHLKNHSQKIRQHLESMKEYKNTVLTYIKTVIPWDYLSTSVVQPLLQVLSCVTETFVQNILKHVPQISKVIWDMVKSQVEQCLKKYCVEGTFCHEFLRTYQRHGLEEAKLLIQRKISQTKQTLMQKLQVPRFLDIGRLIRFAVAFVKNTIQSAIAFVKNTIQSIFSKIVQIITSQFIRFIKNTILNHIHYYIIKLELALRHFILHAVDTLIKYLNDYLRRFLKDEDFRTAKLVLNDAQKKLKNTWRNRKQIAEDAWKPIQQNMVAKAKHILSSRFEVQQYNLQNGEISVKIRNPFGASQVRAFIQDIETIKLPEPPYDFFSYMILFLQYIAVGLFSVKYALDMLFTNPVQLLKIIWEYVFSHILLRNPYSNPALFLVNIFGKTLRQILLHCFNTSISYLQRYFGKFLKDEDFRTAKLVLNDAQRKLKNTWRNRKQIAEDAWKPIQENMVTKAEEILSSRFEVHQYNLQNGEISLKIRNPFGASQVRAFIQDIETIKRKIFDSVSH